jgi:mRNA-degrading endonuclease toxin of MazEF toxin-antitoxin module
VAGSGNLKTQLTDLGVSGRDIKVGQIWTLPDKDINLPANQARQANGAGMHDNRTAVVIQDGPSLVNPLVKTVLVAPTSHLIHLKTANDVLLSAGEGGLHQDSVCMMDHVQPVAKTHLRRLCGRLENHRIEELRVLLTEITGGQAGVSTEPA